MTPLAKKVAELFGKPETDKKTPLNVVPLRPAESWPCPHCGREATIESVEPGLEGELLTLWCCRPCELFAVTPSAIKEPPKGWATKTRQ